MIGQSLGPYHVLAKLGEGGMGEVYRARDTRLGRAVAIKVLPASVAADAERRQRFEREAQIVATLSHPNVLTLFDYGVADGRAYAVVELLEGETLRERLGGGAIPPRKAVDYAVQMARGLSSAHDKSLVHRDLKPENVFLLGDGRLKILDFGLARQSAGGEGAAAETAAAITDAGTVMGTVGYMAPEQVRGGPVDARTDLFAFGLVLYEMLTGRRAFQRETAAETMTAILREEPPPLADGRVDVSPALDRIVQHCLEKNPAERFQTAHDVAFALENLSGSGPVVPAPAAAIGARSTPTSRRGAAVAAALLIAVAAFTLGRWLAPDLAAPATSFEVVTNQPQTIFNARFMPDAETVVLSSASEGLTPSLSIVRPGSSQQQPFGPAAAHLLAVSTAGELAVLTDAVHVSERVFTGTLSRMTLDGAPRSILQNVREADWGPAGSLAIIRDTGGRDVLEYPIGTKLIESGGYLSDVRVSPDGDKVAFFRHPARFDDRGFVEVVDRSGAVTRLTDELIGLQGLAWTRDGRILFSGSLAAEEFPYLPKIVSAAGGPIGPAWASPGNMFVQDVAPDGGVLATREDHAARIGAKPPGQAHERDLTWISSSWAPFLSRDGRVVVFTEGATASRRDNYALLLRPTEGGPASEIGEGHAQGLSPDGRWAASLLPSTQRLMLYPLGAGAPIALERGDLREYQLFSVQWFPDSRHLLFHASTADRWDYYRQAIDGGAPERVPALHGLAHAHLNHAGDAVLGRPAHEDWRVVPLDGGAARPVKGLSQSDRPFDWSRDDTSVFAQRGEGRFERIELATGRTLQSVTFGPSNRTGVNFMYPTSVVDDGEGYSYSYYQRLSRAFRVAGVLR